MKHFIVGSPSLKKTTALAVSSLLVLNLTACSDGFRANKNNSNKAATKTSELSKEEQAGLDLELTPEAIAELVKELELNEPEDERIPLDSWLYDVGTEAGGLTGALMTGTLAGLGGTLKSLGLGLKWLLWDLPGVGIDNVYQQYRFFTGNETEKKEAKEILDRRADALIAVPGQIWNAGKNFTMNIPSYLVEGYEFMNDESIPLSERMYIAARLEARIASEAALVVFGPKGANQLAKASKAQIVKFGEAVSKIAKSQKMRDFAKSLQATTRTFARKQIGRVSSALEQARDQTKLASMAIRGSKAAQAAARVSDKIVIAQITARNAVVRTWRSVKSGSVSATSQALKAVENQVAILRILGNNIDDALELTRAEAISKGLIVVADPKKGFIVRAAEGAKGAAKSMSDSLARQYQAAMQAKHRLVQATRQMSDEMYEGAVRTADKLKSKLQAGKFVLAQKVDTQIFRTSLTTWKAGQKLSAMAKDAAPGFDKLFATLGARLEKVGREGVEYAIASDELREARRFMAANNAKTAATFQQGINADFAAKLDGAMAKINAIEKSKSAARIAELKAQAAEVINTIQTKLAPYAAQASRLGKKGFSLAPNALMFVVLDQGRAVSTANGDVHLLKPEELAKVEDGTVLSDVAGNAVIVGIDEINTADRGDGLTEVGFVADEQAVDGQEETIASEQTVETEEKSTDNNVEKSVKSEQAAG